uniref:Uncharacterized protein n=1 Tax=Anguilla anguilla TaxID=7936 RepID=A0A0E9S672_ANGAN
MLSTLEWPIGNKRARGDCFRIESLGLCIHNNMPCTNVFHY